MIAVFFLYRTAQVLQPGYQQFLRYSCPGFDVSGTAVPPGDDLSVCHRPIVGVCEWRRPAFHEETASHMGHQAGVLQQGNVPPCAFWAELKLMLPAYPCLPALLLLCKCR